MGFHFSKSHNFPDCPVASVLPSLCSWCLSERLLAEEVQFTH